MRTGAVYRIGHLGEVELIDPTPQLEPGEKSGCWKIAVNTPKRQRGPGAYHPRTMTTLEIKLTLPEPLAAEVERMGLPEPDNLRALLADAVRTRRLARLAEARARIAAAGIEPLSMNERLSPESFPLFRQFSRRPPWHTRPSRARCMTR